ncbi:MAG TPA: DoxX family protein [Actinophytocola sp.]|jgi:putative oxidoreductase|nr:DoxX family protein [Actinophytocola sp.]
MNSSHAVDAALLILRLGVGLTLAAHGTQKLFGWFGGSGLTGTGEMFDRIGFRPGRINAALAGLGEAGGGLLLALGLLTPIGGAAAASTMIVASSMHTSAGFFSSKGGLEFPMTLGIGAVALTIGGAGQFSLDQPLGQPLDAPWIAITALVVGIVAAAALITRQRALARTQPATA